METFKFTSKNHITIPGFAVVELGLSGNELICYSLIYGFCQDGDSEFYGSLSYMSQAMNLTIRGIQNVLKSLTEKGLLIKRDVYENKVKYCRYTINKRVVNNFPEGIENFSKGYGKDCTGGMEKSSRGYGKICQEGMENFSNNNIKDNIIHNITDNIYTAEAEIIKDENDIRYERFTDWLKQNAPSILKLKDTFTKDQFLKLKRDFDNDTIMNICLAMQNYKELNKRYTSANLTFRQWAKRRQTNSTTNNNGKTSTRDQRIAGIDQYLAGKYPSMVGNCKN